MMKKSITHWEAERGIAIITALLVMTILLALGIAVLFSASTDMMTTKTQRTGQQAFFAADGGIGVARRALTEAFAEAMDGLSSGTIPFFKNNPPVTKGEFPDVQMLPPPGDTAFYKGVIDRAVQLAATAARAQKMDTLNGSKFTVQYSPISGTVSLHSSDAYNATESAVLRYSIQVTGQTDAGGSATVHETGRVSMDATLVASGGATGRDFKFSGFGAFFDNGDTQAGAPLASGTFSGPVHTNNHFAFLSDRSVTFRNVVSQVESKIRYDNTSNTTPNRAIPTASITGITLSSEGYKVIAAVPLPTDAFSQEYAVINSTGIVDKKSDGTPVDPPTVIPTDAQGKPIAVFDSSGRVIAAVLAANLRNVSNSPPAVSGGSLVNGVYISSANGSSITGAGIYVQGDVSDMQLYADTNGDQVYVIQQGINVSTIRTSYANNTTTLSTASTTVTYSGVFMDKSDPAKFQKGVSLYVNGSISGLRGGKSGLSVKPAIAASTRLTVTAQRDITVTGDIKYANPVANSDGTPVSNLSSLQNVLGIYTNDGNLNLSPVATYVAGPGLSLEINAAVVTFNGKTSNDNGQIEGSIVYTGTLTPGNNDRWKLVGSRVQSKINSIGYNYRDIYFDTRFSGGKFAPPFFPGTTYSLGPPPVPDTITVTSVNAPATTAMSWFRDSN